MITDRALLWFAAINFVLLNAASLVSWWMNRRGGYCQHCGARLPCISLAYSRGAHRRREFDTPDGAA